MRRVKKSSNKLYFGKIRNKKIFADFEGGEVTSDAGILLIQEVDQKLKLCEFFGHGGFNILKNNF